MASIFSRVKDELAVILNRDLVDAGVAKEVRTSRGYDTAQTPYVILTTRSYNERDMSDEVFITIATIVKFADATEEELAETALDDVEQVCIDLLGRDGLYRDHRFDAGHWAVQKDKQTWRPFSPIGPGVRYSEQYFKFTL
jgi:hypothetical protein